MKFKKNKKMVYGKIETLISQDTTVDGIIEASGTIRVDGTVKGGIRKANGVIIGDTGIIEGDIHSKGVNLAGKVTGNIFSETILELLPGSRLSGNIETAKLSIAEGAHFDGKCNMLDSAADDSNPDPEIRTKTRSQAAVEEPT